MTTSTDSPGVGKSMAPRSSTASDCADPFDRTEIARVDVLGIGLSAINIPIAVRTVGDWIKRDEPNYVILAGVHGVMESVRDDTLRRIHNRAGLVCPDGMPMVWLARSAGHRQVTRVYGPDLMLEVCRAGVASGWKHYLYGGNEGVADELRESLCRGFPGLQIVGTECPPFRPLNAAEEAAVCRRIDSSGADIVWVGLSTPKQERWMNAFVGRIGAPVAFGVGAAFDFHTGRVKQAPGWMQRNGLEWFYRLIQEPKRLWKRYLFNNPAFVTSLLLRRLRLKRFGSIEDR